MFITLLILARTFHIAAALLIAGTFTFQIVTFGFCRGPATDGLRDMERSLNRLAVWILVAALVSALFWFWLEVVSMTSLSFPGSTSGPTWKTVLFETEFGHVWQLRLGIAVAALVVTASRLSQNARPWQLTLPILWLLSVVLLVSLAWISHAAARARQPTSLIGDALHLYAAGA